MKVIDVKKLKEARLKAGLTQDELAKRVGITQTHVSKIETNESAPAVETLDAILQSLNLRIVDVWIQDSNPPQPPTPDEQTQSPGTGAFAREANSAA